MPSRARAGTTLEARLAYRSGPVRQTGPRAGPDRAGPDRAGPNRAGPNRAGPNRAGPDRAHAGLGRARPIGQLYGEVLLATLGFDTSEAYMHVHAHASFQGGPCIW